jgi:hypothetical protein
MTEDSTPAIVIWDAFLVALKQALAEKQEICANAETKYIEAVERARTTYETARAADMAATKEKDA